MRTMSCRESRSLMNRRKSIADGLNAMFLSIRPESRSCDHTRPTRIRVPERKMPVAAEPYASALAPCQALDR